MTECVESEVLSGIQRSYEHRFNVLRVLLFCMKYPKLKFTTECIAVNQGMDRLVLEQEMEGLINQDILSRKNDSGITYYWLNRTTQELTDLTQEFLRDWHPHETGLKAIRG